ncbi:uncharacterized protein LOC117897509 isoform X2 [Drosophila subobscura]|uniref:uncharacterized protein LOC117897509 isoform X2 n=1 Tax=Drosophila subobscura TaxID=7241 RepID=UPI00155A29D4|nr:uncharacterized protein LOC117897509 isoform X2 [Drosophila subobscura]
MKKKKHSVGVQNYAAISRMPLTDNARKIQTEATKPKGTTLIQVSMEQSLIVIQDRVNLEQEQQQDAMLSVKRDEQLWDLTDDESVMSIGSSGEDRCTEVTPITIDALKDNTSAVDRVSSQNAASNCENTKNVRKPLERYLEKRRLIKAVKKRRVLYDTKHPRFHDRDFKNEVWRCIARRLSMDMEACVDIWNELRYEFQCHKREMLNYKQKMARHRPAGRRPFMVLEEEMCFLYPHVASYPLLREKNPAESVNAPAPAPEDDVVLVSAAQPMTIIYLDLDNESFRITPVKRRLIEAVRYYPQLYNASNISYNDYHHRGLIWGAISNELGDKATKLMKSWIILLTRYEWEVSRGPDESSELMKLMVFLIPHIPHMKESVYKTSKYLTAAWHYPIENFRSVETLIKLMKGNTELVQLTEEYLHHKNKPPAYHSLWQKVAAQAMSTPESCEVTWLVLRSFHSELVEMRLASYKLNDKWLFENTINEIYKTIVDRTVNREGKKPDEPDPAIRTPMVRVALLDTRTEELLKTAKIAPRMSLAIAYPPAPTTTSSSSTSTITNPTSVSSSSSSTTTTATSTATTVPSTVSSSPCSTILKNDGLKFMNTLSMAGRNSTLVMSANTAPGVLNGKPVPKVFVVRRSVPLPVEAPAHEIPSWMTMQTASLGSPAPPVRVAINQTSVPDPPTTPLTATSMTAPSGALKRKRSSITVNGEGTGSSETGINEIYKTIVNHTVNREGNKPDEPDPAIRTPMVRVAMLDTRTEELLKTAKIAPRMSLAIAYPPAPTTTSSSSTSTITNPTSVSSSSSSTTTTATSTATTVPSTVSSSPCSTILKNDGLKFMNTLSMAGRNSTLVMSANTAPGVLNGKPVPKVFVVRRSVPLPVEAPAHEIPSWMTMQTASLGSPAPPVRVAINQTSVPDPPTTPLTATSMTAPSGALSITVNGEGTGGSETGKETEIESNVHKLPAIANTRLQMQIISKIKVELLTDGNSLHIHGGALITDYTLHKERVGMLIREVMDIPILHNNNPKLESKKSELWGNVARKFHMPADACRATWKFLSENISLFPAIAPMPDLMGLHKGYAKNWQKSERVFKLFEEVAAKNQWIKIRHQLPLLMIHFRMYEHLYSDMRRPRPGEILQSPRVYTQKQSDDVWRVAKAKFSDINHMEVWSTFKLAFRTYMDDLEMGIENPWPRLWWQAFDQLRFLVNVRYHPLEPYYYIVHTKIRAEVKRCSIYEKLMPTRQPDLSPKSRALGSQVRIDWEPLPWETEEARRLLTGKLRADTVSRPYVMAPPPATATAASPAKAVCSAPAKVVSPAPAACPAASACAPVASPAPAPGKLGVDTVSPYVKAPPPATATAASPAKAVCSAPPAFPAKPAPPECAPIASPAPSVSPDTAHAPATSLSLAQSLVPPRPLVLVSKEYKGGTMPDVKCYGQPLQTPPILQCATQRLLPILPAFEMTTMLKQYPNTFRQATTHEKRTAWVQTATELNTTVIGCRMSMQHALRESRILKIADPTNKCQLGQSYYRHINDIYSEVKPEAQPVRISQLLVRTPEQLNQTQIEGAATLGTRRFMPEISMSNAHPRLVLKNWSHALATFSPESQQKLFGKLTKVFAKHALASSESIAKNEVIEGSHTNHTNLNF